MDPITRLNKIQSLHNELSNLIVQHVVHQIETLLARTGFRSDITFRIEKSRVIVYKEGAIYDRVVVNTTTSKIYSQSSDWSSVQEPVIAYALRLVSRLNREKILQKQRAFYKSIPSSKTPC